MGTEWLVTIWRWKIYVFSNWWLVSAAGGGLRDIPGHWGHLIWSDDGIVCGWPLVRAGHEEIIYPRFIVKLLTALERLGPHRPATWAGHGTSRVKCDFWAGIFHILQSRSHVPCVSWEPLCAACHMRPGDKNTHWRAEQVLSDRDAAFQTSSQRAQRAQHWALATI